MRCQAKKFVHGDKSLYATKTRHQARVSLEDMPGSAQVLRVKDCTFSLSPGEGEWLEGSEKI